MGPIPTTVCVGVHTSQLHSTPLHWAASTIRAPIRAAVSIHASLREGFVGGRGELESMTA